MATWLYGCCLLSLVWSVFAIETKFVLQRLEITHTCGTETLFHRQLSGSELLPVTLPSALEDGHQLDVLVELDTGSLVNLEDLEQVWISFVSKTTKREYLFLPCRRNHGSLLFQVKMDAAGTKSFEGKQGDFLVKLVVGDHRVVQGLFQLLVDSITLRYRVKEPPPKGIFDFDTSWKFYPLEEIEHQFKTPVKRAPIFVSFLFTGLVVLPLVVYIFWILTTCDVFPLQISKDGGLSIVWFLTFHLSIAAFLYCFVKFWLSWNILKTWKVMLAILPVTWISGMKWMQHLQLCRGWQSPNNNKNHTPLHLKQT